MKSLFIDGTLTNAISDQLSVLDTWMQNMSHPHTRPACLLTDQPSPFEAFLSPRTQTRFLVQFHNHATLGFVSMQHIERFLELSGLVIGKNVIKSVVVPRTYNTGPISFTIISLAHTPRPPTCTQDTMPEFLDTALDPALALLLSRIPTSCVFASDTRLRRRAGDTRSIAIQFPQYGNTVLGVSSPSDLERLLNIPSSSMFRQLKLALDKSPHPQTSHYTTSFFPTPIKASTGKPDRLLIHVYHAHDPLSFPKPPQVWLSGV